VSDFQVTFPEISAEMTHSFHTKNNPEILQISKYVEPPAYACTADINTSILQGNTNGPIIYNILIQSDIFAL